MAELRELKSMNSNDGIACKFPVSSEKELMLKQRMTSRDGFESTVSRCKNYIILHRRIEYRDAHASNFINMRSSHRVVHVIFHHVKQPRNSKRKCQKGWRPEKE